MRLTPRGIRRTGFTVIELLVVMAIIIAITSLAIGAVFSLRESQMKNYAETTVQKLASALDQQFKATLDQIFEETPSPVAMNLAGQDIRRGRVIHTKLRLRQEFPVNFTQANTPILFSTGGGLAPKPSYLQALQGLPDQPWSSSAMLYMILSQGRRGMAAFDPATVVEPTAIRTGEINGKTFQYFVDPWDNPLRFWLFPTGNDEINAEPYIRTANNYTQGRDVQDPEDTLMSTVWNTVLRKDFRAHIHDLHPTPGPTVPARHLIPVVASAGKDGLWGVDPITMAPILGQADDANDNIYSYRLRRAGARGD
jgi:type II secretory pathway pseudopilin PulG